MRSHYCGHCIRSWSLMQVHAVITKSLRERPRVWHHGDLWSCHPHHTRDRGRVGLVHADHLPCCEDQKHLGRRRRARHNEPAIGGLRNGVPRLVVVVMNDVAS